MILVIFAVIISALYVSVWIHMQKWYSYWNKKGVPVKKPEYFIGNLGWVLFRKYSSPKYVSTLCDNFKSPYFVFFFLGRPYLVVKRPDLIKRILVTDFQKFPNKIFGTTKDCDPFFGNSLLSLSNPLWKKVRSRISKIFSPTKVKAMFAVGKECGIKLKTYLDDNVDEKVNIQSITIRYSTEVLSNCAFGIDSNSLSKELNIFTHYAHNLFPKSYMGTVKGFSYMFFPQLVKIFKYYFFDEESCDFFKNVFLQLIELRQSSGIKRNDLMGILLDLHESEENKTLFDQKRLISQAIAFMGVGHETISSILALTICHVSLNSEIQDTLRREINEVTERYGDITMDALNNMKYLEKVIFETLRMYPVIQFIQRECAEDCVLPETGITLEKGTLIIIPTYWLHYNEEYFSEPNKFNPDRFDNGCKTILESPAFFPFSAGPRSCIGRRFALLNLKIGICYIIKHFVIERDANDDKLSFGSSHSLEPKNGMMVRLKKI